MTDMTEKEIEVADILLEAIVKTRSKRLFGITRAVSDYAQFISAACKRASIN
jgi:hypothetical protein